MQWASSYVAPCAYRRPLNLSKFKKISLIKKRKNLLFMGVFFELVFLCFFFCLVFVVVIVVIVSVVIIIIISKVQWRKQTEWKPQQCPLGIHKTKNIAGSMAESVTNWCSKNVAPYYGCGTETHTWSWILIYLFLNGKTTRGGRPHW